MAHDVNSLRQAFIGVKLLDDDTLGNFVMPHAQLLPNAEMVSNTKLLVTATLDYVEIKRGPIMQGLTESLRKLSIEERRALPKLAIKLDGLDDPAALGPIDIQDSVLV